jgi:hypothetical protein
MAYEVTLDRIRHNQEQGCIDRTPPEWFRRILSIPRKVENWEKEGEVIDALPPGEEKRLAMRRMQCAAADNNVLWFQGHVFGNYKAIGAAIEAALASAKTEEQPV